MQKEKEEVTARGAGFRVHSKTAGAVAAVVCVAVAGTLAAVAFASSNIDVNHTMQGYGDTDIGSFRGGDTQVFNNGPDTGSVTGVTISGDPDSEFALGPATTCTPTPHQLLDQQQCNVSVIFTPVSPGLKTATLTIDTSNAINPQRVVSLSGTGLGVAGGGGGGTTGTTPPPVITAAPAHKKCKKAKKRAAAAKKKCKRKKKA
jgi:hypothetical protein